MKNTHSQSIDATMKELEEFAEHISLRDIHDDFMSRFITISIAALSFIAVLAWDHVLKEIFPFVFPHMKTLGLNVLYALFLTIMAAVCAVLLPRAHQWYTRIITSKKIR